MSSIKLEDCVGRMVRYSSNVTKGESWNGLIRKVVLDEDGEIEINGCNHDVTSIVVHEFLRQTSEGIVIDE